MKKITLIGVICLFSVTSILAQNPRSSWKRSEQFRLDLQLFHSMHVVSLPTAETLQKGDLEFEVSHRFIPPVTSGSESFYGLDGPVNMRLALGYAVTDRLMITLGRSNLNDNLDLQAKLKMIEIPNPTVPLLIALQTGAAYNSQIFNQITDEFKKYQFYGQLVFNTLIKKKIGLGMVPSYLYNSYIYCKDVQYSFTLGNYIQYYVSPSWSLLVEWNPTVTGWRRWYNSVAIGFEIETGGHFFKIFLTNNDQLNTSQYLTGADLNFEKRDRRLGFMITRLLKFKR